MPPYRLFNMEREYHVRQVLPIVLQECAPENFGWAALHNYESVSCEDGTYFGIRKILIVVCYQHAGENYVDPGMQIEPQYADEFTTFRLAPRDQVALEKIQAVLTRRCPRGVRKIIPLSAEELNRAFFNASGERGKKILFFRQPVEYGEERHLELRFEDYSAPRPTTDEIIKKVGLTTDPETDDD